MVLKNGKTGRPPLMLISIGTTEFPFPRLTSILIKLNKSQYQISDKFTPPDRFVDLIKKADKIIVHAGPATLFLVVKHARFIPLIIPRLAEYKEHVDNHQLFFTKYLRDKLPDNLKRYFVIDEKIDVIIDNYLKEKSRVNNLDKFLFLSKNNDDLVKNLEKYTGSL
jgi:hypothetical protein